MLAQGADGNAKRNNGKTALRLAANEGHTGIAELLKKAGALSVEAERQTPQVKGAPKDHAETVK